VRADLQKSLIYLDREYIADLYEVATGQSPETTITSSQGKKAGASIPVFSAEVSAQETRSFKISTLGMLAHAWDSFNAEPDVDFSNFSLEMRSQYGWCNGELSVYKVKTSVSRSDGTSDVLAESEHFQIRQSPESSLSLITTPEYFVSGLGTLVKLQKTVLKKMSIPVRAFVRVFAAQDHAKQWVAVPLVILER
jgi:hypothetical protein